MLLVWELQQPGHTRLSRVKLTLERRSLQLLPELFSENGAQSKNGERRRLGTTLKTPQHVYPHNWMLGDH